MGGAADADRQNGEEGPEGGRERSSHLDEREGPLEKKII